MSPKIPVVFLVAFILFQVFSFHTDATIIRRDVAPATTEKNELEEALHSFQQGVKDLINKVEGSELYQNTTKVANEFGQKIKQQGEELIKKLKATTPAPATH